MKEMIDLKKLPVGLFPKVCLILLFAWWSVMGWGQVSLTTTSAVTEAFTGYTGTAVPANWTTTGTGTTGNTFQGNNQTGGTAGGWYGNANMSYLGSGNASNGNATWRLVNNTGSTITGFTFSFAARMWKSGSASPTVTVSYAFSTSSTVPAAGALTNSLTSCTFSDATANIATGTTLSQTVSSISIPTGNYIFIRFINSGGSSADNLGWDDVTITPTTGCVTPGTPACSTPAAVCAGSSATITGAGSTNAASYTYWTASTGGSAITTGTTPPGTVSSSNLTTPTSLAAGTYTYYVQGENGTSCSSAARQAVTVTVNAVPANPTGSITPNANPSCGPATLTYSGASSAIYWQTVIGGTSTATATTSTYTLSSTGFNGYVRAYNGSCWSASTLSTASTVTIYTPTAVNSGPSTSAVTICENGSLSALVCNAVGQSLSYQWYRNTTPSTTGGTTVGTSSSVYTPSNTLTGTYYYYCVVTGASPCGSDTSVVSGAITVNPAPAAPTGTITPDANPSCGPMTLTYSAPDPAIYWQTSSSGISTASPTTAAYAISTTGFTVYVRSNLGSCWSTGPSTGVTIYTQPSISSNPTDKTVLAPASTTFAASASGTVSTRQWQVNNGSGWADLTSTTPYSGATSATLTVNPTSAAMDGYLYRCIVSASPCLNDTSAAATLTINSTMWSNTIAATNPSATNPYTTGDVNDVNITVSGITRSAGLTAASASGRFSASGWPTGALDASDYFEFVLTPASGYEMDFTSFTYTATLSSGAASHAFRSSLDGFAGNIGTTTTTGTTLSLAGAAYQHVTTPITFRYYAYGLGASTTTYSINDFSFVGKVVPAGCTPPTITGTTPGATGCGPGTATLGATSSSGTVNWYIALTGGSPVATGNSYAPSISATTNYYVDATDAGCTTSTRTLVVATLTTAPGTPACSTPSAVCAGTAATITGAGSAGATAYTYWTAASGGNAITTGTTPPGTVTGNNLATPTSLGAGSYIYYVQGENGSCISAARQAVTVTVNAVPANPTGTISVGSNPACGSTTLTYSAPASSIYWQTAPGNTSTANPTTSSYTLSSSGTMYVRAISGGCASSGTVSSAGVTVNTNTSITTPPSNVSTTIGAPASFTVVAAGTSLTYQWRKGGVNIGGAVSATYTIPATVSGDAGSYDVVVTGTCGTVTSSAVTLTLTTFVYQAGDYRPMYDYDDLSYNNSSSSATDSWEYFDGTSWGATPAGKSPQNATTRPTRVIINKIVTGGGNNTTAYNNIVVLAGGELILNATGNPTATFIASGKSLEVKSGGKITLNGQIQMTSGDSLIVRNGGEMDFSSSSINNTHSIWSGTELFEPGSKVSVTDWGFTGSGSGSLINVYGTISDNAAGYKFGTLDINVNPAFSWVLVGGSITLNLCDTLNVTNASSNPITIPSNTSSPSVTIRRINHNSGIFGLTASYSGAATQTINILENLTSNGGTLKLFYNGGGTAGTSVIVNLKGDLTIGSGVTVGNDVTTGNTPVVNFTGTTTQSIDAASTITGWPMNFTSGTYIAIKNNNLTVNSNTSLTAPINVKTGATLDFGFAADNITANVIKKATTGAAGTNQFITEQGSTLKITSPDGIQQASATTGNVQFTTGNKTFNQLATFWYIGRANQVTGDGLGTASNGKQLIIEMNSNSLSTTLSQNTGLSNATTINATGGKLDIRKGQFLETLSGYVTSSTGTLYMAGGTLYQTPVLSASGADVIPRMDGVSFAYTLNGGTVELNGTGKQTLRGSRTYYNVKYSGSNSYGTDYKNLSNGVTINDSLIITGSAVVNSVDTSFNAVGFTGAGGVIMDGGRLMIKTLNTTTPELTGVNIPYNMTGGTVEFYGTIGSTHQVIRGTDNSGNLSYYNIDVNANAANTSSYNAGVSSSLGIKGAMTVNSPAVFQLDETENISGVGSFEVKGGATFKYGSANGIKTSGTGTSDGNIRITGSRTLSTSASYGFVGNGAMVSGNGLPSSMVNMYIQKSGTADVVTLTNSATATGVISFTTGKVSTGSNELISNNTSASSLTGYGADKYVIGNLRRYVGTSGSYDYPLGNSSYYDLATLSFNSQSGITSLLGFFTTGQSGTVPSTSTCAINGSKINDYLNNGFWTFTPDATMSSGTYDITLNAMGYTNGPSAANRMGVIKRANSAAAWLGCGLLNGSAQPSSYGTHTNSTQSITAGVATAMRSGVTGFSEFGIGLPFVDKPLPVTMLYLTATAVDNRSIRLDWATASEINNNGFEIGRSTDGVTFENTDWVDGHGTTNVLNTYSSDDNHVTANVIYYYRLRQVDADGHFEYSNIVSAMLTGSTGFVMQTLRPNPASGQVALDIITDNAQAVNVSFTDMLGREVLSRSWQLSAGMNDETFDINALADGVYHVTVRAGNNYFTKILAVAK